MDDLDTPGARIKWARKQDKRYTTASAAAKAFGWAVPTYLGHENGDRAPSREAAMKYAAAYKVPWPWILEGGPKPDMEETVVAPPPPVRLPTQSIPASALTGEAMASQTPAQLVRADVPVWASAESDEDGALILINEPINWILRSDRMQGVKDPFAFQMVGGTMSPAIEHGELLVINPSLLPIPGKDHVFKQTREDGAIIALVRRYLRPVAIGWRVRQFNPLKDFDLPKSKWSQPLVIGEKRPV